ncbi:hypothetical protein LF65_03627 [Clostridium beijerinckii]|uniref:Uncharacterized protein n=1 Tax=Clostridium beijerinckii TaxID=1520 RepID=A0A0B5QTL6_CLOBE|nr:hypothetical protein [Clostridium beijerinckii]AJH00184.1 hypothetical protein LF65_03627 [Clostridium beijerinckii]
MIEIIDGRIYRVKNFAKYQNIKVKEKAKSEDNDKESKNNVVENEETNIRNDDKRESKVNSSDINKQDNISKEINDNISQNNIPIYLEVKKNKKAATTKKKEEVVNITDKENDEDDEMFRLSEGELTLGEGEQIIASWTF